ncbi:hypothetical protein [Scytonema sp. UIC 10036]|uniref:hypothetical protein n=1 Tax=Scytonema sp. UIC 10036 TaxID=2304196 RepID=UPI00140F821C|nr:hypothetical protein [Scytonema sp. UIC 10036]
MRRLLGFWILDLGFGIWDLGFGIWDFGLGIGHWVWGIGHGAREIILSPCSLMPSLLHANRYCLTPA